MRASMARPGYALLLALLVVAPLLRPGYLLLRDAVSTPRSYLSDTALGTDVGAARDAAGFRGGAGLASASTAASW